MVVSSPEPAKAEKVRETKLRFRKWLAGMKEEKLLCFYPWVGRGSAEVAGVSVSRETFIYTFS